MNSMDRRAVLLGGLGIAGGGLLAACSGSPSPHSGSPSLVSPFGPAVNNADKKRRRDGSERNVKLTASAGMVDLGGQMVNTWTFGGDLPGKEIRITAGDTLVAELANHLPAATSVHWHGVALRNDMDGVPPITQWAVSAGGGFTYRFVADQPGTYWFHPHVGVQLDRGLYGPLIIEDPHEPLAYDEEWVVVLDDWLDGVTGTPDQVYAELQKGMGAMSGSYSPSASPSSGMGDMGGMSMSTPAASASPSSSDSGMDMGGMDMKFMLEGASSKLLGGDAGDVDYPYHLVNGRVATAPSVYQTKPGKRLRVRIINAGADTAYRVALGGHKLTITHTDGYPVEHEDVDAVLLGMGERYDVLVTLQDGVFPLVALAEGKNASGMALVRTGSGTAPAAGVRPKELDGRILPATRLQAASDVRLASRAPDLTHRVELTGGMATYNWSINGIRFDENHPTAHPFLVDQGQRVRLEFVNKTTMWHPMHLHGHTYQLTGGGPRKDTVIVLPHQTVVAEFDADNPGQWVMHCHNDYHMESGMMALLAYST